MMNKGLLSKIFKNKIFLIILSFVISGLSRQGGGWSCVLCLHDVRHGKHAVCAAVVFPSGGLGSFVYKHNGWQCTHVCCLIAWSVNALLVYWRLLLIHWRHRQPCGPCV